MPDDPYVGRFAPSPTGPLHFGSLVAALASYLDARSRHGRWLVRVEDIDPPREVAGAADDILRTLEKFQLCWDGEVLYQSTRTGAYAAAAEALLGSGDAYRCRCTRRMLSGKDLGIYPGRCRRAGVSAAEPHSIRAQVADTTIQFDDLVQGPVSFDLQADIGDFVIWRRDSLCAYQLAATVDDMHQRITHVIRGIDLLDSTPRQLWLRQRLYATAEPRFGHIPVAAAGGGEKLSKQTGARPIEASAASGGLRKALLFLQQDPPEELAGAPPREQLAWAVANWKIKALQGLTSITVDGDHGIVHQSGPNAALRQP